MRLWPTSTLDYLSCFGAAFAFFFAALGRPVRDVGDSAERVELATGA